MTFLEMFHQYSDHDVYEYELGHEYEYHEEYRCDNCGNATIFNAISGIVAIVSQRVFHDTVPIVTGRNSE